jgi:hypothetical protein
MVEDRLFDIDLGQTEMQLPSRLRVAHPSCGRCRRDAEQHSYTEWEPMLEDFWSNDS